MPPDEGKLLISLGKVRIMYGLYSDAPLRVNAQDGFKAAASKRPNQNKDFKTAFALPLERLVRSIRIAPSMAQVAIYRITTLAAEKLNSSPLETSDDRTRMLQGTVEALYKYFGFPSNLLQLPAQDPYWERLDKIQKVYEKTLKGLLGSYDIYLFDNPSGNVKGAHGFVRHDAVANPAAHPLRMFFFEQPAPNGHIKWTDRLRTRPIHLWVDALKAEDQKSEDGKQNQVARLLLHEATHNWGYTLDIKYKWQTVAKQNPFKRWEEDPKAAAAHKAKLQNWHQQPMLERTDRVKPLLPMHHKDVTPDQWVLNADSYAYAAYRMWKAEKGVLLDMDD